MKTARRVLILSSANETSGELNALAESLAAQGAVVVVRRYEDNCDPLLDEIAAADSVICWR